MEDKRSSTEHFDELWSAPWSNVQALGPLTHTRYRLVLSRLGPLPAGSKILDVGCGSGVLLERICERFPGVEPHGVEYSSSAKEQVHIALRDRVLYGDFLKVAKAWDPGSFEAIVTSEVLEHVEHPDLFLSEMYRLLKPGGQLVITVPAGMKHWSVQDEVAGHFRRFEVDELKAQLEATGFQRVEAIGWGRHVAQIYSRLVSAVGPAKVMRTKPNVLSKSLSALLNMIFRLEDIAPGKSGFQLVASGIKPS